VFVPVFLQSDSRFIAFNAASLTFHESFLKRGTWFRTEQANRVPKSIHGNPVGLRQTAALWAHHNPYDKSGRCAFAAAWRQA
jgi:hypothetical protein